MTKEKEIEKILKQGQSYFGKEEIIYVYECKKCHKLDPVPGFVVGEHLGFLKFIKATKSQIVDLAEKFLDGQHFTPKMARAAFEKQKGVCPKCGKTFPFEEMQADHITPWSKGGKTVAENCQMLCADCNRRKSNI